ncbi:MAG: Asp/Glu racemase [Pseudomonadota bacterium]
MAEPLRLDHLDFETDAGLGARARIGLVALATDYTIEHELNRVFAHVPGVALYVSRIGMDNEVTRETLAAMEGRLAASCDLILPGADLDAVLFGCSSATAILGADRVAAQVHKAKPGVAVSQPISAASAALRSIGARQISVLTPYTEAVNAEVAASLTGEGFEIAAFGSFDEPDDPTVASISPEAIAVAARQVVAAAPCEALFISCTSLRALDLVSPLEEELGIGVTASNHALAWHALRLAGLTPEIAGFGRLYAPAPA